MALIKRVKKIIDADGNIHYQKGLSRSERKKFEKSSSNLARIATLKEQLESNNKIKRTLERDVLDPHQVPLKGALQTARTEDHKKASRAVWEAVRKLKTYGVIVVKNSLNTDHIVYKEGGDNMAYTRAEMLGMKVDIINESAAGNLSKPAAKYMLEYVNLMIEKGDCDDKECLVSQYLDAAKDGDKEEKEKIMKKIKNADKSIDEMLGDKYDELSDDDKKVVDKLKEAIEGDGSDGGDDDNKDDGDDDDNGGDDDGDKETKESAEEEGDDPTQEEGDATDSKKDKAELAKAETEMKEFVSLSPMSKEALNNYVTESVASGQMSTESASTILNAIRRR